ncbi:unnamed protein product, partial [Effrenium voratum]
MQRQVLDYQAPVSGRPSAAHRLKSVRHALTRNVAESGATMLRTLWQCWVADTAQCRQRSDCQRRLDQARAKLTVAKQSRAASCRKIVSHMLLDSDVAPLVMCLQAWTQFMQEEVKEKAAEAKVQTIERRLKARLGALLDDQAEDGELVVEIFQTWLQHSQEESGIGKPQVATVSGETWADGNVLRSTCLALTLKPRKVAHVAHAAWTPIPANFAGLPPASRRLGLALLAARLRRCQRRVASLDRPVKRLRARRRPPAPVMSQRTALEQAPSLEFLGTCLASGRLEEADQVTRDLLLVLAGGPALARGFLQPEEVPGISAEDLRALDRLWVKYSEGRLGYSVQRERLEAAGGDFQKFMHEIGWLQGPEPMLRFWPRREFDYSLTAPQGHLPLTNLIRGRELLLALLRHPAFAGAATAATADVPVVKEATTPEVRDWWAKLTGGADDEELDSTTDPEQTSIERPPESFEERGPGEVCFRITLITGFETFNARLYRSAARQAADVPGLSICVFTDKDIAERRAVVQQALETTDVFFCSLIFDFDQAEWLREACQHIEVRMIFESALELMSCTK